MSGSKQNVLILQHYYVIVIVFSWDCFQQIPSAVFIGCGKTSYISNYLTSVEHFEYLF